MNVCVYDSVRDSVRDSFRECVGLCLCVLFVLRVCFVRV